jgi:hypothetical protein
MLGAAPLRCFQSSTAKVTRCAAPSMASKIFNLDEEHKAI